MVNLLARSETPTENEEPPQRLKRVFAIDIEKCEKCGGKRSAARMKVIACIEEPEIIDKILKHLGLDQPNSPHNSLHNRSPPGGALASATTLF
jgi:hypothetical protein